MDIEGQPIGDVKLKITAAGDVVAATAPTDAPTSDFPPKTWKNPMGMQFVRIPAGSFMMGSDDKDPQADDDEKPRHKVNITHAFLMAKYEVTNAQFRQFRPRYHNLKGQDPNTLVGIDNDSADAPACLPGGANILTADAFCDWLNDTDKTKPKGWVYSLPTEAQWEYAARGPQSWRYPWGDVWDSARCDFGDQKFAKANLVLNPQTAPYRLKEVQSFPTGESPFGVAGMAGGLWEWCLDTYDPRFYGKAPDNDPANLTITDENSNLRGEDSEVAERVLRGGSWASLPIACRAAHRHVPHSTGMFTYGIRVVLVPEPAK
jgi:formylglycine-generating enzyme required for sulfatase activity